MLHRKSFYAWLLVLVAAVASAAAATGPAGIVAEGTKWATPYYVRESGEPGPTVMIVGGVHGNEPAGAVAARHILNWPLTRGRLVVVPRANEPSLRAGKRRLPTEEHRDLNRNFPRRQDEAPRGDLAAALWRLVRETGPDWLLDLHEGFGFRKTNRKTTGSTIISVRDPETVAAARRMLDAVNATVTDEDRKHLLLRGPAVGSLARAAAERLGARAMILESTYRHLPLSLRARHHRLKVHRLLTDLEMVSCGPDVVLPLRRGDGVLRVSLYDAAGTSSSKRRALAALRTMGEARTERLGPPAIRASALGQFDVLVMPGGSGSKQAKALGEGGRTAVRRFVRAGGGYVGICAGAYLAAANYSWSLAILDARVIDRKHWRRGKGTVRIELTAQGRELLAERNGPLEIYYANGPLLAAAEHPDIPDFRTLAHFRDEINENDAPEGVMLNTPSIACGRYGRGRVLVFSPHPERTQGRAPLLLRAVRWAGSREEVPSLSD
ncbi:MAG: BPL-N domain-containing protein [Planctomycetota bacterium]